MDDSQPPLRCIRQEGHDQVFQRDEPDSELQPFGVAYWSPVPRIQTYRSMASCAPLDGGELLADDALGILRWQVSAAH